MSIQAWSRRDFISFFLFSVLVGCAIKESLKIVSNIIDIPFIWSKYYFSYNWSIPVIYSITLLRFYIGHSLYLKYLSEKKKPEIIWSISFVFMLFQFTLLTLMGMTIKTDIISKGKFFWMLFLLLMAEISWIIFLYIANKFTNNKIAIPKIWFYLSFVGVLFLGFGYFFYRSLIYTSESNLLSMGMCFILLGAVDLTYDFLRVIKKTYE